MVKKTRCPRSAYFKMKEFGPLYAYIEKLHPLNEEVKERIVKSFVFKRISKKRIPAPGRRGLQIQLLHLERLASSIQD